MPHERAAAEDQQRAEDQPVAHEVTGHRPLRTGVVDQRLRVDGAEREPAGDGHATVLRARSPRSASKRFIFSL